MGACSLPNYHGVVLWLYSALHLAFSSWVGWIQLSLTGTYHSKERKNSESQLRARIRKVLHLFIVHSKKSLRMFTLRL